MNKNLFVRIATPLVVALACSAAVLYFSKAKEDEDAAREEAFENLVLNED